MINRSLVIFVVILLFALMVALVELRLFKKASADKNDEDDLDLDDDLDLFDDDEEDTDRKKDKPELDVTHAKSCLYVIFMDLFPDLNFDTQMVAGYTNLNDDRVGATVIMSLLPNDIVYFNCNIEYDKDCHFCFEHSKHKECYIHFDHAKQLAEVLPERTYLSYGDVEKETIKTATFLFQMVVLGAFDSEFKI